MPTKSNQSNAMYQFDPDRNILKSEKYRLLLSIQRAKSDIKSRWNDMPQENRDVLRHEWSDWFNNSYPNDEDICFLDYWKSW